MNRNLLSQKGLSLVEVVIAALIVSVVVAGIFAVYGNASRIVMLAQRKAIALSWAESELEKARIGGSGAYLTADLTLENDLRYNALYSGQVTLTTVAYGNAMARYTSRVTWNEP